MRSFASDRERLKHLQEIIEPCYFDEQPHLKAESDKAWDAMHRALADGQLSWDGGEYPLNHVVLGGELLYTEPDYVMSLKTPQHVRDIAQVLPSITEVELLRRYMAIDAESYQGTISDEDFEYTWHWFQVVSELYPRAASEGRFCLFTVDQ